MKKTVFVGLSGGVDSSVSAALLQKRGFNVVGVFLKVWQPDFLKDSGVCTQTEDMRDAMRVAAHLKIPFLTLDCAEEYKKQVVDHMINEYRAGRVPNPDVLCNREVKFGVFMRKARKHGADFIATGHYARALQVESQKSKVKSTENEGKYQLLRGVDKNKDQSYFLWTLTQDDLAHTLFPVGGYQKKEVRVLAKKFGLPTAEKKDSQGICFVGKVDMKEFLTHFISRKTGDVLNERGEVIGQHGGAILYAIGERHGFSVHTHKTTSEPLYVITKDVSKNTLTVASKKMNGSNLSTRAFLSDTHWIAERPLEKETYSAHVRYRGSDIPATVSYDAAGTTITLAHEEYLSAGQSLVLYDGETCMGGGIIKDNSGVA